ncbi:MAG: porin family protein [Bacteroidales bacterium]
MKKKFFSAIAIVLFLFPAMQAFSQGQLKYGFTAGFNINNVSQDLNTAYMEPEVGGNDLGIDEVELETNMRVGFHAGPVVDYAFTELFGIRAALLFTQKGYNSYIDYSDDINMIGVANVNIDIEATGYELVNYLEFPLEARFRTGDFQAFAGPYIGLALGGKSVVEGDVEIDGQVMGQPISESDEIAEDQSIKPVFGKADPEDYEDEKPVSAIDFGMNAGIGYKFGSVMVDARYSLGLGDMIPDDEDEDKQFNRVIYFSVSYFLK